MGFEGIKFPVYRKYKNNKSYFKIINPVLFEEVQIIGKKRVKKKTEAKRYPEKSFIRDLVLAYKDIAEEISEAEYLLAAATAV